jgi:archaeal type IV pilus assembly protein PilA
MNIKCRIYLGGAKEKMKNFNRNLKAISPIFATLILIAIAVIAGVVVYMFTSGTLATMTGGGTAAQEKISIQAASYSGASTHIVTIYAQTTGGPSPVVNSIIIKDSAGNTVTTVSATVSAPTPTPSPAGTLAQGVLYTITGTTASALASGTYTATLVTNAGGSFISPSFTV